jgi:hypothetical protein
MAYPNYLCDLHLLIWLKQKKRRNKRSGSCTFAGRYTDANKRWLSIVQYPLVFGCPLACRKISAAKSVLADAFVVFFQFQVAFLQHINICDLNIPPQQPAKPEQRGIKES